MTKVGTVKVSLNVRLQLNIKIDISDPMNWEPHLVSLAEPVSDEYLLEVVRAKWAVIEKAIDERLVNQGAGGDA